MKMKRQWQGKRRFSIGALFSTSFVHCSQKGLFGLLFRSPIKSESTKKVPPQ